MEPAAENEPSVSSASASAVGPGLDMPLREAMQSQRAIRRLLPDPVEQDVIERCIELALKAPTGSNAQNWEWIVVRDPAVKRELARLNRIPWSVYGRAGRILKRKDPKMLKILDAVQWQADHYEEIPVLVIPCLRGLRFNPLHGAATAYYGSAYPAVQNFLLAARAEGLGAALTTLPLWSATLARRALGLPFGVQPIAVIPVGWPQGRYGPTTRRPVRDVIHHDRFGSRSQPSS